MTEPNPPGSVERRLRFAASQLPHVSACIAHAGTNLVARQLIYDADKQLRKEQLRPHGMARGLSEIVDDGDLAEVFTEAICAAEALGL
jgi:hypothetical protein